MINWIYDEETYPNIFCIGFKNPITEGKHCFEISWRVNQLPQLLQFISDAKINGDRFVGFNNIGFDYPVLHFIIENQHNVTVLDIYNKANSIIMCDWNRRFDHMVWDRDHHVPQVDLYKIHHFDNVSRATSLKVLEFNMRLDFIEDLPYPPGSILSWDECDNLISYMWNDIDATEKFFGHTTKQLAFREELTEKYGRSFINHNDTKIGKDYFIMELERLVPGFNKKQQTKRDEIRVADILFDYIKFNDPELQRIHNWFAAQTITDTSDLKGVFKDIQTVFEDGVESKVKRDVSCSIRDFKFVFGAGGIHGSVESCIIESDDEHCILDLDVASYYPNLAIANKLFPLHLGEHFCAIYQDVYNQRKQYAKKTTENEMLKLALNGVYGDSNNKYSCFYDPHYTLSITINGQLLLCMLAEQLMTHDQVEMIQINTDGLTIKCPVPLKDWVNQVGQWWQDITGLELEGVQYNRMFIRDVNSYIGEYTDGKLKRKGAYEHDLEWHKNHSSIIVAKAAEAALVHGQDIRDFIENHGDVMDFMLRTKVPRSSKLALVDYESNDNIIQNVSRYYISVLGGDLVKIMPPTPAAVKKGNTVDRRIGINTGWKVSICNDIRECQPENIEFDWYVKEAEKLVNPLRL
jgi:hypothetical protein